MKTNNIKKKLIFAFWHFIISLVIASLSAIFVFSVLYPKPFDELLSIKSIYLTIVIVDVICGPALTLILVSNNKSKKEQTIDLIFIALIQIAALFYGLLSAYQARPAVIAFELDRVVLVTANQVQTQNLHKAPKELQQLPYLGLMYVGTKKSKNINELMRDTELAYAGVDLSSRPEKWITYHSAKKQIKEKSKSLSSLITRKENKLTTSSLDYIEKLEEPIEGLSYLPFVSSKNMNWSAILDQDMNIIGYIPLDGFTSSTSTLPKHSALQ